MNMVFVYGSLQRGERNHRMMAGARLLRVAKTAPAFELFDLGSFPAMVARGTVSVVGELYAVDEVLLKRLDVFEGHPRFYRRTEVGLDDGTTAEAYLMARSDVRGMRPIVCGNWKARSAGEVR